jgi:hypothetical protein
MKRFTVRAATVFLVVLAFLACWHFSRPAPRASLAVSGPRHVPAAIAVAAGPHPTRNPQPATPLPPATRPPTPNAQSAPLSGPSAFTDFSRWAEQFLAGATSASAARGTALAWKRRVAMLELIQTDPQKALALTVPFGWRSALPASVTRFFEQQVDGRGALDVAVAEDFKQGNERMIRDVRINGQKYGAFVYGRRLRQGCQPQMPLHGIVLDGKMAVSAEPIRLLGADEAEALAKARGQTLSRICGVCGALANLGEQGLAADIGGELACFCGVRVQDMGNTDGSGHR